MPSIPKRSPWDFTDALKLLKDISGGENVPLTYEDGAIVKPNISVKRAGLGDFSGIWEALGTTQDPGEDEMRISGYKFVQPQLNPVTVKDCAAPDPNRPPAPPLRDETYASDGGYHASRKNVTWNDEPEFVEATDVPTTPTSEEGQLTQELTPLFGNDTTADGQNATSRKREAKKGQKKRRKLRKQLEQQEKQNARTRKVVSDIESESEIRQLVKPTPAAKASKHSVSTPPASLAEASKIEESAQPGLEEQDQAIGTTAESSNNEQGAKQTRVRSKKPDVLDTVPSMPRKSARHTHDMFGGRLLPTTVSQPAKPTPTQELSHSLQSQFKTTVPAHIPVITTPTKTSTQQVYPSIGSQLPFQRGIQFMFGNFATPSSKATVQQKRAPVMSDIIVPTKVHMMPPQWQPAAPSGAAQGIQPLQFHSSPLTVLPSQHFQILEKEERDFQLFLRLVHEFSEDKKWLTRPVPMADHNSSPTGIHVFVDFSNIWIGFMDHLKQLQVTMRQRIPHQNISFDALVLLLERKRPVAKRVLAGSYPLMPAMELAKQIGYETLILEKVYKSREPSERQRRMLALQSRNSFTAAAATLGIQGRGGVPQTPPPSTPAAAAAPITTLSSPPSAVPQTPTPAPEKWVEQGVDEILHLKILESIVDSEVPSRMVVATGDAAKAEYSEGFMKMIVRALRKGWCVELVAFSKSISGEYRSARFLGEWEGRFQIVVLDRWAQFLLDT
jgi:hypothetical protein